MGLVAHDCGYPLSRYTCRATRVAADFLDFIAFCRCSTGVALHPLQILVSHLPPRVLGGVAPKFGSEKVSRYTGVSQLQLRVSRCIVQLRLWREHWTGSPKKSIDQIGKNCPKKVRKLCFRPLRTIFSDIFSTFFGHFVGVPIFWAVQRFAHYKPSPFVDCRVVGWSAGCHVDHPCGGQISPWPARKVTDLGCFFLPDS